jgi:uncharacterized protein (DUF885 family)
MERQEKGESLESTIAQFHQLLDDHWEEWLIHDPLFATYAGVHKYDHLLPGGDERWNLEWLENLRGFEARLLALDRLALPSEDQLNYDIFARYARFEIRELELRGYHLSLTKAGGVHLFMPDMYLMMPMASAKDYENYIARLEACLDYFRQVISLMRLGLKQGYHPPRATLEGVDASLRAQLVDDPLQSPFYQPFSEFPNGVSEADQDRLRKTGFEAIRNSMVPAYRELLRFFREEYFPSARQGIAADELPDGRAFYEHRVRYYTTLMLSPEEVYQIGVQEVSRIRAEMEQIVQQVGFQGGLPTFIEFMRTDPRFYVTEPLALLKETSYVLKRMDGELPRLFKTLPRLPYGIRPIPDFSAPGSTAAYYFPGTGDGSRAGVYYVNTYDLKSRPLYEIEALSLHEAVPGHHLQIAMQQELPDMPNFRRQVSFTAYVEGWALYAERLGLEVGFYRDPYSNFGRLSYEMWRACRLVVDTGMHALGWSRQQAIDFMAENTSSTMLNIINEVDRYIAWPGQALAYKIGELKIRELRKRAETALGARFDLREFHDVILLCGSVPLDILENRVISWIGQVKS